MQNLSTSRHEAFFHLLGLYASCLKEKHDIGRNIGKLGEYEEIDSCEELMLECSMNMLHGKKWDGKTCVKTLEGYS